MTEKNFEWVVGSDLRSQWAYMRLNATPADEKMLVDSTYVATTFRFVEQKNWSIVRRYIGYARFDTDQAYQVLLQLDQAGANLAYVLENGGE
jgi:hypothetical protein